MSEYPAAPGAQPSSCLHPSYPTITPVAKSSMMGNRLQGAPQDLLVPSPGYCPEKEIVSHIVAPRWAPRGQAGAKLSLAPQDPIAAPRLGSRP